MEYCTDYGDISFMKNAVCILIFRSKGDTKRCDQNTARVIWWQRVIGRMDIWHEEEEDGVCHSGVLVE